MGVTGLWTVVAPTARPTKLETLHRKRLAVDASIWIYQFLKAVRDKEGNALRNSHVIGFFRRICKLLYFGIKPVFVFDGGAPVLKRETIRRRVNRREGRRDDAARTAGKLLAVQVARAAEEESKRAMEEREREPEEEIPEDQELVYVDEIGMNQAQRQAGRGFKKKDQYHLPELDVSLAEMGAPNDPRVMSQAELEEYAKQFHSGEDINLYDFSKIDFESPFFQSLPAGDKYNILNAARLRSRLRMGYSKEQLDDMFPDRMAFSRFQIERVKERNELTQRLMHVSNSNEGDWDMGGRIAGERGKEYVLVKNDGVEGGWALGVVSNKQGSKKDNAIDLDAENGSEDDKARSEDEDEFEDVAIEGVNRIPQSWKRKRGELREVDYDISYEEAAERIAKKRKAVYDARKKTADQKPKPVLATRPVAATGTPDETILPSANEDAMFVGQENEAGSDEDEVFEDVTMTIQADEDDDELQRAIAMSLEKQEDEGGFIIEENDQNKPQFEPEDDDFDLTAALAESRQSKYKPTTNVRDRSPPPAKEPQFGGPLPFESLNLGQSLLGKKKSKKVEEDLSGGFDRDTGNDAAKKQKPMPGWFNTNPDVRPGRPGDMDHAYDSDDHVTFGREDVDRRGVLHRQPTREVIDLEGDEEKQSQAKIDTELFGGDQEDFEMVEDEEDTKRREEEDRRILEADQVAETRRKAHEMEREKRYEIARQIAAANEEPKMDEVAENVQAEPPPPTKQPDYTPEAQETTNAEAPSEVSDEVDWSESDTERPAKPSAANLAPDEEPAGGRMPDEQAVEGADEDDDDIFEDVEAPSSSLRPAAQEAPPLLTKQPSTIDQSMFLEDDDEAQEGQIDQTATIDPNNQQQEFLEDDSDEELMRQLANEAEEHLRFTNELNNSRPKSPTQAMRDYETELKQLRNQQKKDRRDADEVTQTMIQECQALLRLFGLPYITAPMEAEAQCAELVHLGLVDGIVTDDSDIFLFGGTRIYKNMFNAAKFVECYLASDLEKEYALDRQKLIRFAHLLGSDYTEGIPGIGPVTALEIISDFADLSEFKEWTLKIQLGVQTPSVMEGLLPTAFRRKFKRQVQRKLFLPTTFPDLRVDEAYLQPEVDSNPEEFQWGVPDLDKLRSFLMATIGWTSDRTDEVLVPVIRDMNKREVEGVQSNITRFFSGGVGVGAVSGRGIGGSSGASAGNGGVEGAAPRNRTGKESSRLKNAYTRLRGEAEKKKRAALDEGDDGEVEGADEGGDRDGVTTKDNDADHDDGNEADDNDEGFAATKKRGAKKTKKQGPAATSKGKKRRKQNMTDNY
ncbi:DNA repair protein rad2 [Knufia obscura]|uniref:DNA repair protein rad2 n=2 Tax=Knufia TaxID=430999 RepID=A0AAN8I336_9EURO|nr:DNA repair protein rad2 [Knufia obscura]KAK5952307.1 DNA repair protein rad2 [Knufia fluminis]